MFTFRELEDRKRQVKETVYLSEELSGMIVDKATERGIGRSACIRELVTEALGCRESKEARKVTKKATPNPTRHY